MKKYEHMYLTQVRSKSRRDNKCKDKICCNICSNQAKEIHHMNYSKPKEVVFLCKSCHRKLHGRTKNISNSICRLSKFKRMSSSWIINKLIVLGMTESEIALKASWSKHSVQSLKLGICIKDNRKDIILKDILEQHS